jgi:hypothetical protein
VAGAFALGNERPKNDLPVQGSRLKQDVDPSAILMKKAGAEVDPDILLTVAFDDGVGPEVGEGLAHESLRLLRGVHSSSGGINRRCYLRVDRAFRFAGLAECMIEDLVELPTLLLEGPARPSVAKNARAAAFGALHLKLSFGPEHALVR